MNIPALTFASNQPELLSKRTARQVRKFVNVNKKNIYENSQDLRAGGKTLSFKVPGISTPPVQATQYELHKGMERDTVKFVEKPHAGLQASTPDEFKVNLVTRALAYTPGRLSQSKGTPIQRFNALLQNFGFSV